MDRIIVFVFQDLPERTDDIASALSGGKRKPCTEKLAAAVRYEPAVTVVRTRIGSKKVDAQVAAVDMPEDIEDEGFLAAAGDRFAEDFQHLHFVSSFDSISIGG